MSGKREILVPPDQENARLGERRAKGLCVCPDKSKARYIERHDEHFCFACGKWCGATCGEPECEYCAGRPEHPEEAADGQ